MIDRLSRRGVLRLGGGMAVAAGLGPGRLRAAGQPTPPEAILESWYLLVLELVRHTATYSPPVAARAFGYLGVTAWEAVASADPALRSLAGQAKALDPLPARAAGDGLDTAAVLHSALAEAVGNFFGNTGPTGQRAMAAMRDRLDAGFGDLPGPLRDASRSYGKALADHVLAWSAGDGGAQVENMGFPQTWQISAEPGHWSPTSSIVQQQAPLLPDWGGNRPFAMPEGAACGLPPPPAFSEDEGSAFHAEAMEVYAASGNLTDEQIAIARFWSDDPMLSPTPPGHWISIIMQIAERDGLDCVRRADALARVGMALSDAFIGCWHEKFRYDLIRPVTYIRKLIDPAWEPLLITPPFPEYPSGHSTQSAAAAAVLTRIFGEDFAFDDATHEDDGLDRRSYPSFRAAAEEAAISRLYGGIHFRSAIEQGLAQGDCVAAHVNTLRTLA